MGGQCSIGSMGPIHFKKGGIVRIGVSIFAEKYKLEGFNRWRGQCSMESVGTQTFQNYCK